jgi:peptidoglycan/xylan/chitin deacetylase (PgdA/CDA1 family)
MRGELIDPEYYLRERYLGDGGGRSRAVTAYYALKPLMPPRARIAARRLYARRQVGQTFPRWPIEPILVEYERDQLLGRLSADGGAPVPVVYFWPDRARAAVVLTHDVEGPAGIERIPQVRALERRYGFTSAWYFVAEDYAIPDGVFDQLRREGCEIGLHGIHHDGKLFASRAAFESNLPAIHRYLSEWHAVGFRSPATHRNPDWMSELGCLYDTSFSDSAPFEPQPGGCCSIRPYFLDGLVELPMTLIMDHTLWEILRDTTSTQWVRKAEWLLSNHGLVNLLVHPDYVTTPERARCYDEFLRFLSVQRHVWHALPRQVAAWWRARAALDGETPGDRLVDVDGRPLRAVVSQAREVDDQIVLDG